MKQITSLCTAMALTFFVTACGENTMQPERGRAGAQAVGQLDGSQDCDGLPVADPSLRVDLDEPVFSNPTQVDNRLFPIGKLERVVLLGSVDGLPLRVETTLMGETRTIEVDGHEVEVLESQYVAWLDGEIHEVALDWYGQDDKGAVWYFGEDVFNYEDGVIADTDGTWLAGEDGPVAMIMPSNPQVGNVWRPENICGFVFEEVSLLRVGEVVEGPRGSISNAIVTEELHMDATYENKIFAPGYGEFSTGDPDGDLEAVAVAVPIDALVGDAPAELDILSDGAERIFQRAKRGRWDAIEAQVEAMEEAWEALQATQVPPMLRSAMDEALAELDEAVEARDRSATRQAGIHVELASLDLELRHEERAEIDGDLIELWLRQLQLDAQARDRGRVRGDLVSIRWISARLRGDERESVDQGLRSLGEALSKEDWAGLEADAAALSDRYRSADHGIR